MRHDSVHSVILSLYDAAIDPALWPATLDRCVELCGAASCAIFDFNDAPNAASFQITHAGSGAQKSLMEYYTRSNIRQEVLDRRGAQALASDIDDVEALSDEIIYSDYAEFIARPNVQSLMELGLRHRVIAFLNKDNFARSQFTLQYADGRGPASQQELRTLNLLLPHMAKAVSLQRHIQTLEQRSQSALSAIDHLALGLCILDSRGRVVLENIEFRRQRTDLGMFCQDATGYLQFKNPRDQKAYASLLADAQNHGKFGARPRKEVISSQSATYLNVEMLKIEHLEVFEGKAFQGAVIFSRDTTLPIDANIEALSNVFGLTKAEAALAEKLANGLTNAQIADANERALGTINGQVKSILAKTRCSNRTQFVSLLANFTSSAAHKNH